jgi:hypothetical protein
MLHILLFGMIDGLVTAGILHLAYNRLQHRPKLQLSVLMSTLFFGLLPGIFCGLMDMNGSNTLWYWQADLSRTTVYILGWMTTSFFGFGFVHVLGMSKSS